MLKLGIAWEILLEKTALHSAISRGLIGAGIGGVGGGVLSYRRATDPRREAWTKGDILAMKRYGPVTMKSEKVKGHVARLEEELEAVRKEKKRPWGRVAKGIGIGAAAGAGVGGLLGLRR